MSNFVLVIADGIELKLLPFTCSPYNSEVACCTAVWEIYTETRTACILYKIHSVWTTSVEVSYL